MGSTEKELSEIYRRVSKVLGSLNFFLVKHSLSRRRALEYAVELRRCAELLESLVAAPEETKK